MMPASKLVTSRLPPARSGATLVELLASMAILGMLLVLLGTALQGALGRFRSGVDRAEARGGAETATAWLKRDLASATSSRPANLPPLPAGATDAQRRFFEGRLLFPFEVGREKGNGADRSFPNAAPEFDSLAFVAHPSAEASFDPERDLARLSGAGSATSATSASTASEDALVRPSIIGYYVAYTRDSPLADFPGAGMKLYRHHRPGGDILAGGYAGGFLLHCSHRINDAWDETGPGSARSLAAGNAAAVSARSLAAGNAAAVPSGRFANAALPFLLSRHVTDRETLQVEVGTAAWPALALSEHLPSPPPTLMPDRGSAADWRDPGAAVHDTVFPDEPVCANVVRFELTPLRRVTLPSGDRVLVGAAELNAHLDLPNGDEWPCLVEPHFLDVVVGVVDETTAERLSRYEDWIVDWSANDPAAWSPTRRLIEEGLRTRRFRISLSRRPS